MIYGAMNRKTKIISDMFLGWGIDRGMTTNARTEFKAAHQWVRTRRRDSRLVRGSYKMTDMDYKAEECMHGHFGQQFNYWDYALRGGQYVGWHAKQMIYGNVKRGEYPLHVLPLP